MYEKLVKYENLVDAMIRAEKFCHEWCDEGDHCWGCPYEDESYCSTRLKANYTYNHTDILSNTNVDEL